MEYWSRVENVCIMSTIRQSWTCPVARQEDSLALLLLTKCEY